MLSLDAAVIQSPPIPSERRLWVAVLRQAVCDLMGVNTYTHGSYRLTVQHFARLWVESTNREPGSFLWVCDQLEFDAGWLRRRLLEMAGKTPPVPMRLVHRPRQVNAVDPGPAEVVPEMPLPLPQSSPTGDLIRIKELTEQRQPEIVSF